MDGASDSHMPIVASITVNGARDACYCPQFLSAARYDEKEAIYLRTYFHAKGTPSFASAPSHSREV